MTLQDKIIRSQLELTKPFADGSRLESARSIQDKIGKLMHFTHRRDVVVVDKQSEGIRGSLIVPRDEIRGGVLLYLHGGGYACGTIDYARGFASVLAAECGIRVLSVEYRLAPEAPYPAALDDAISAYRAVISAGCPAEKIILVGESAGAGLEYALCLRLKELGEPMPAGIIAISPWIDLTLSGDSYENNKEADPSLSKERLQFFADCYVGAPLDADDRLNSDSFSDTERAALEDKKRDPLVSPLFADLTGMPPSIIFVGSDEILLSDSTSLKDKLTEAGCDAELYVREDMWHAYVLYGLKSCRKDYEIINSFIKERMPKGNERKLRWMSLDNVAKIYPAARTSRWNNIYRLSATLTEKVDRDILQSALDVTVRRFPSIAVRLKRGAFWYYLEEIARAPSVVDERSYPLVRMPFDDIRSCAFRVLIYGRRIAVEFFHALTDGNGGLVFLKTLLAEYISQRYGITVPAEHGVLDRLEEPSEDELKDLFPDYASPLRIGRSRSERDSYRIYGTPEEDGFCHDTTFIIKTAPLLSLAHSMDVSLTALLAAAFIKAAIGLQYSDKPNVRRHKRVKVLIPCDLRRIYGVNTLRNFVLYSTPGVDPRLGEYSLAEIAGIIKHKMALDITEKSMSAKIYTNVKDEQNLLLKLTPLFLKNLVMKTVFFIFGEKKSTLTMSNLGAVKLPEAMKPYVERFDFVLSVQSNAPYNAGVISFGDSLYLNVIRNIKEPRLEAAFYRVLRDAGIGVKVESNDR